MVEVEFVDTVAEVLAPDAGTLFVVGAAATLKAVGAEIGLPAEVARAFQALVELGIGDGSAVEPAPVGSAVFGDGSVKKLVLVPLADSVSRHMSAAQSYAITAGLRAGGLEAAAGTAAIVMLPSKAEWLSPSALGIGRALPLYSAKTSATALKAVKCVFVGLNSVQGIPVDASVEAVWREMNALRRAQFLSEAPAQEVGPSTIEAAAHEAVGEIEGVSVSSVVGADLLEHGLAGIHLAGGDAAGESAARMVVLEFQPKYTATGPALGMVGAGVSGSMGGAAAVLGAFETAVKTLDSTGFSRPVVAVLCLADASAPAAATAAASGPDVVLTAHSGKTVELGATIDASASSCLLLSDGLSYLARERGVLWLASTTATPSGVAAAPAAADAASAHASAVSNRGGLEQLAVASGLLSGDQVTPLPFTPEVVAPMLQSGIADMKLTAAAAGVPATSGVFLWRHLEDLGEAENAEAQEEEEDQSGGVRWLHCTPAGPGGNSSYSTMGLLAAMVLAEGSADWVGVTPLALMREMLRGDQIAAASL